jgi:hypothetical protein
MFEQAEPFAAALVQRTDPEKTGAVLRKEVQHGTTLELGRDDRCGIRTGLSVAGFHARQTGSGLRSRISKAWLHLAPPGLVSREAAAAGGERSSTASLLALTE